MNPGVYWILWELLKKEKKKKGKYEKKKLIWILVNLDRSFGKKT